MKTITKKVLVVVFMLGTLFNYANDKKNFKNTINAKKVKVVFKNVKEGHSLIIRDSYGMILHSEFANSNGDFIKFYDFSSLKNGNYKIELNKDLRIIVKSFQVKFNGVLFQKGLEKIIFKPIIKNEKNVIYISKSIFDKQNLNIQLFYNDEEIYKETILGDTTINKRVYKLLKNVTGEYTIVVKKDNRNYIKKFKI